MDKWKINPWTKKEKRYEIHVFEKDQKRDDVYIVSEYNVIENCLIMNVFDGDIVIPLYSIQHFATKNLKGEEQDGESTSIEK